MSTTINETVTAELSARGLTSYTTSAQPVIQKLTEREREISDKLLAFATDQGASAGEVREFLVSLGMEVTPEPEPEPEDDDDDDRDDVLGRVESALLRVEQSFGRINERLDDLEGIARRYGAR